MKKCKITVLKRNFDPELAAQYISFPDYGKCHIFQEGQVFYTGGVFGCEMPEGFCPEAWDAIGKTAAIYASGGKQFGFAEKALMCCNDGGRPVVFLLEPFEDGQPLSF